MGNRANWLSATPEPERELPLAVATLRHRGPPPREAVAREQVEVERLVLAGPQQRWLAYLREVIGLIEVTAGDRDPDLCRARARAGAVIDNHHNLLLGLPGRAATATAGDRARLARLQLSQLTNPATKETRP